MKLIIVIALLFSLPAFADDSCSEKSPLISLIREREQAEIHLRDVKKSYPDSHTSVMDVMEAQEKLWDANDAVDVATQDEAYCLSMAGYSHE